MSRVRAALTRIAGLFNRDRVRDDVREELEAHLDMETAELIRRGLLPDEARRQALLASGGITQAAEAVRDQRGVPWIDNVVSDIRYAFRSLRHSPAFTTVVVITLALGIGANTAIFSVLRGVLLKPLPHRDGNRLVYLRQSADGPGRGNLSFSVPEVRDLRTGVPSLAGIAEYSSWSAIDQTDDGSVRINVGLVTGNYFDVMGLAPVLGRLTHPGDDGPAAPLVVVLTHDYWRSRFGGDSGVVGKKVTLNRKPVTVIGVLQPAPFFPERVDALLNMVFSEHHLDATMTESRTHRMTEVVARLEPGATLERVSADVAAVYARLQKDHAEAYDVAAHQRVAVVPFHGALGERARPSVWLLMAAAAFVLIVSAANVANLTLMRGVRREQELVVRAALGAGVGRLRRLLAVENLILAILGAGLGVVIAIGGVGLLTTVVARYSPRAHEIRLDGVVLAFALTLSVGVALLLSFLASLPREGGLASRILSGTHRISGSPGRQRLQRGLVVVQIAVSVVLLAGAGLLTRTLMRLSSVQTGLTTENVLTMQVTQLTQLELQDSAAAVGAKLRFERMRDEIAALPGVSDVGIGWTLPLRNSIFSLPVDVEGRPRASGEAVPRADIRNANPDFFRAAGIPLVEGRGFTTSDGPRSGNVVIVNQVLADRFFPGESPIGRRIATTIDWLPQRPDPVWQTIVGVVGNTQDGGPDAEPRSAVYSTLDVTPDGSAGLVIRSHDRAGDLAPAATAIVRRIAPFALIEEVMTIAQYKAETVSPRRLNAVLISSFGMLAILIAAVGIAGVLAFSVSARTNEIGIRMSLGADGGRVQRMILHEGGSLVVVGLALGVLGAFAATGVIRGLLFGVEPHDPVTFAGVVVVMAAVGIVACWIPALRASRIDPVIAMRA
jgi:putative ABC transport system permease protein